MKREIVIRVVRAPKPPAPKIRPDIRERFRSIVARADRTLIGADLAAGADLGKGSEGPR